MSSSERQIPLNYDLYSLPKVWRSRDCFAKRFFRSDVPHLRDLGLNRWSQAYEYVAQIHDYQLLMHTVQTMISAANLPNTDVQSTFSENVF